MDFRKVPKESVAIETVLHKQAMMYISGPANKRTDYIS